MTGAISFFAASEGVPLAAEQVFKVGPLVVTNTMFFATVTAIIVAALFVVARVRTGLRPRSMFAFVMEQITGFILDIAEQNFSDRKKALHHLPLLLTLFTFILVGNLSELIPGVGSLTIDTAGGNVPLLRAFTTDLNATLALAILSIGLVQIYAVKELGILGRLEHFFTRKPWNPMNLFIGLVEVLSELIRIMTLSMRLFGVIYAGEVLIHVMGILAGNFGWAATLPIYLLETFFGVIQAYIFMMLTTVYLSTATQHETEHEDISDSEHSPLVTEKVPAGSGAK